MRAWGWMIVCALLAACGQAPQPPQASVAAAFAPDLAKKPTDPAESNPVPGDPVEGARVARRVGCDGCHAEGGKGGAFDIRTPDGDRIVAPNLTERRALYDDAGLAALLRQGKTHDGHIPVGMPIKMLQHLSDREVRDIIAWLRSLPALDNPGLARTTLKPASLKQFADGTHPYSTDMQPDPLNRPPAEPPTTPLLLGRHIALTTCGECHGWDLNGFEGDETPSLILVNKSYSPEKFTRLMRTGQVADGGKSKTGFMSKVATDRFADTLTDVEIAALKQYLDSR